MNRTLRLFAAAAMLGCFGAATASAQDIDPEAGGVWVPPADDTGTQTTGGTGDTGGGSGSGAWYQGGSTGQGQGTAHETPPPVQTSNQPPSSNSSAPPANQAPSDGRDDHERVVGHVAVGYMGLTTVPIGSPGGVDTVSAPAIGIRYWVGDLVGVDVGLGLGFIGGNVEAGSVSAPVDNAFAMVIHGGIPLAIFHAQHYKFLIIPELNIGFSTGTNYGGTPDQDRGRSGLLFQIGGRLGTEIHFGFMDIPQLSLQASVGIYFDYASAGVGSNRSGTPSESINSYGLGTSVQGEPWDILLGALTALYYFE